MTEKMWGSEPFWGLGYEWDPDWVYTEHQKELRSELIELCETQLRPNAKRFDDELMFPRPNLEILGEHGFLALDGARGVRRASARTTSPTRWCARRSPATGARRRRCAT